MTGVGARDTCESKNKIIQECVSLHFCQSGHTKGGKLTQSILQKILCSTALLMLSYGIGKVIQYPLYSNLLKCCKTYERLFVAHVSNKNANQD